MTHARQTWVGNRLDATSSGLTLDVTNSYGALEAKGMYAWKHIAEPHKV